MTEISDKILETIKEKKMKPTPRFKFLLKSYAWAILAFLMVVFGSLAVSVIIFYFKNEDWSLYRQAGFSQLNFMLMMIPYFWVILSLVFVLLAYYNFRHTKFGYRYRFSAVVLSYFALSILIGSVAYASGAGEGIEGLFFNNNLVFYGQLMEKRQEVWNRPEKGFIAGEIVLFDANRNEIEVLDPAQKTWIVDISAIHLPPFVKLNTAQRIRVIGKIMSDNLIKAQAIKPFFIEPVEHCNFDTDDCNLIHHPVMKENLPQLRIIN